MAEPVAGRDEAFVERRGRAREQFTPLVAVCAWVVLVSTGMLSPELARAVEPFARCGEVLVLVLALHALHEAGHVLAGLLVGMPFSSVTLGLLTLRRDRRGPLAAGIAAGPLMLDVNRSWKRFAGCVEREVSPGPGVREALTVTALGGPAASIIGGALLTFAPAPWAGMGLVSILIGAFNAVPVSAFGQASDGMLVWRLWSRRPEDVAWRAQICGAEAPAKR